MTPRFGKTAPVNDPVRRFGAVAIWLLCLLAASAAPAAQSRPNILLIMTDDLGWADLTSYGAPDIRTPHIDSLARDGVRLTDFYSNGLNCSPTRAGLMSGRYQQRYGIERPLSDEQRSDGLGLVSEGVSLPQQLKSAGYATALIGKWHLGYARDQSPNAHGFDYFFGLKSGYHDFYTHHDGAGDPDLWENDQQVSEQGYMTDLITERTLRKLDELAKGPFFIDVAYNAPHWPYQPPNRPSVAPGNARHVMPQDAVTSSRADYVAMVEHLDAGVGRILARLEALGLANNTIVIFTNDNGGEWLASGGPLFNRKSTVWEGGIRVPALLRWPGRIPAGTTSDQVGITMDLTASLIAAAGAPAHADSKLEGVNLLPILEGKAPQVERTLFWRSPQGSQRAVRSGDWKLVVDGGHVFLFDVRRDIGERNDLAKHRQDVAQRLHPLLRRWEGEVEAEAKARLAGQSGRQPARPPSASRRSSPGVNQP